MAEQNPELFHTHRELSRDEREWVRPLLRLLGGSVLAHALLLAAFAYVPALRDAFAVAGTLSGLSIVSEDYEKTRVEYERATIINLAAQQLYYPAGYLTDQTSLPSPDDPQFVAAVNPTPLPVVRQPRPKPTPSASPSPTPSPGEAAETAENAEGEKVGAAASPTPQTAEEAERLAKEAGAQKLPQINVRPFEDLLKQGKKMKDAGEVDLNGTLEMTLEADRKEDGTFTNIRVQPGATASNPKLVALATDFATALGDSKALVVFEGAKHLVMKIKLDDKQVDVSVVADMTSESAAERTANAYGLILLAGGLEAKSKQKDEAQIFTNTKLASDGKQIILTFRMPRKDVGDLLSKFLKKNEASAPTPAPTS